MGLVGVMICVIMIGGALLPAVSSATDNERTIYNNEANLRYSELFSGSDSISNLNITLYVESFTNAEIKVTNGGVESTITPAGWQGTLIMCDKLNIRWDPGNGNVRVHSFADPLEILTQSDLTAPLTISIANGTITVTDSADYTTTVTPTEWLFIPDEDGAWETVLHSSNGIYVNDLNQVYFSTIISTDNIGFMSGHDGIATTYNGVDYSWSFTNMEKVNGYVDLYRINMSDFRFGDGMPNNADESPIIPYQVIVPRSVDAHTNTNVVVTSLFNVLPLVAITGLVMAGIYVFISRK